MIALSRDVVHYFCAEESNQPTDVGARFTSPQVSLWRSRACKPRPYIGQ